MSCPNCSNIKLTDVDMNSQHKSYFYKFVIGDWVGRRGQNKFGPQISASGGGGGGEGPIGPSLDPTLPTNEKPPYSYVIPSASLTALY